MRRGIAYAGKWIVDQVYVESHGPAKCVGRGAAILTPYIQETVNAFTTGGDGPVDAVFRAIEQVTGYSVVWAAEAYGSDAATVLAWVAAQTERILLGLDLLQNQILGGGGSSSRGRGRRGNGRSRGYWC